MMNISFSLTFQQIRDHTKTVTRRLGWKNLKPGTLLQACDKCRGLGKGGHPLRLCVIRVLDVRHEPLWDITEDDVKREGFDGMSIAAFITIFCEHMNCSPGTIVTRIEFEYV